MAFIYETENFIVESHDKPEIDRKDGGHIKISPKKDYSDRTQLSPKEAIELMRLTIVTGRAFKAGMEKSGIHLGRINYQENGNWLPHLHIHLYGRAKNARWQKFGDPIIPGHRQEYEPLTIEDIRNIREEILLLFTQEEFSSTTWFSFDMCSISP